MNIIKKSSLKLAFILLLAMGSHSIAEEPSKPAEKAVEAKAESEVSNTVILYTNKGEIEIELFLEKAPISSKNFLKYVDDGFFSGTVFHRVMPGFMIQGGGFEPGMKKKRTRAPIKNEANNGLENKRGTLAMARTSNPDSATAQFFINLVDNGFLNYTPRNAGYAVFGKVVKGMDAVDAIAKVETSRSGHHQNVPVEDIIIEKAVRK